ncbi:hypothetical protein Thiowin_04586 [Thiorhodovibrio winogradskyi]|uniref:Uncharacterized protein n=1 Tax=Thiorhodovibrio winogradskyi TaxID=77007 RepID=A0ABZ0SEW1_9GAMM|nr:hypothetical protein [Thiorhodovibrio winogradskyi]
MGAQIEVGLAGALLGEKVVHVEQAGHPLKKERELFLDALAALVEFMIRPTIDMPALVDQAVLEQQVVFVFGAVKGGRLVNGARVGLIFSIAETQFDPGPFSFFSFQSALIIILFMDK